MLPTIHKRRLCWFGFAGLGACTVGFGQVVFDATADFSLTENPHGVWSYGFSSSSNPPSTLGTYDFILADTPVTGARWDQGWTAPGLPVNAVIQNTSNVSNQEIPPGWLSLHPVNGGGAAAILRFTAPAASSDTLIAGQFLPGNGGTPSLAILHNGTAIWTSWDGGVFSLDHQVLAVDDTLDFAVYGAYAYGATPLDVTITSAIPEPSVYGALLGAATLAIVIARRRRESSRPHALPNA